MILPIILYGNPILRKKCLDINLNDFEKIKINQLITNMFETMHKVKGIGLAAPQIGKSIRLFIVETPFFTGTKLLYYKEVFLNAKVLKIYGKTYPFHEGCLSLPGIIEYVTRKSYVLIEYYDKNWKKQRKKFMGICARVILHEYDHIEGKLFIDYFSDSKKKRIRNKFFSLKKKIVKNI
ncbi:peptide deformylase [Blattabacterium cuenoti]|uniref:peptide deformylase n=1 Tax=Blattabacterium cuenoti TaxID=1653831 RepID=UPI00163C417B|nr:peptide deformylase [Blattabacterium cuenoti]